MLFKLGWVNNCCESSDWSLFHSSLLKHKSLPKLFQNIIHDDTKQRPGTQRPNVYSWGNIVMTRLHAFRLSEPSYLTLVIKKTT